MGNEIHADGQPEGFDLRIGAYFPPPAKLARNTARCCRCYDVIVSEHVHDLKRCRCGAIFVDGGLEYVRRGAAYSLEDISELSEWWVPNGK